MINDFISTNCSPMVNLQKGDDNEVQLEIWTLSICTKNANLKSWRYCSRLCTKSHQFVQFIDSCKLFYFLVKLEGCFDQKAPNWCRWSLFLWIKHHVNNRRGNKYSTKSTALKITAYVWFFIKQQFARKFLKLFFKITKQIFNPFKDFMIFFKW